MKKKQIFLSKRKTLKGIMSMFELNNMLGLEVLCNNYRNIQKFGVSKVIIFIQH